MNSTVGNALKGIQFGKLQVSHNLAAFPILGNDGEEPCYITLGRALKMGALTIEEVSEGGSVPEVAVLNSGELPVILLDGEELAGAKQNRVLNATVLLKAASRTIVDVSCTERGRWAYTSREFNESDEVMAASIRAKKSRSVSASLRNMQVFRSDQGEIWNEIDALCISADIVSRTDAMRDVYQGRRATLDDLAAAFPPLEKQRGLVFLVNGAVVGMDMLSRSDAYAELHNKLLRSYLVAAELKTGNDRPAPAEETVRQFIDQVDGCAESAFPSVGLGVDLRFEAPVLCGSALVHENACVHIAFFATNEWDSARMRDFRRRTVHQRENSRGEEADHE